MSPTPRLANLRDLEPALAAGLAQERWFADKHREIRQLRPVEAFWLSEELPAVLVLLVEARFVEGEPALYHMVLGVRPWDRHLSPELRGLARRIFTGLDSEHERRRAPSLAFYDAFADPELGAQYLAALAGRADVPGDGGGQLHFRLLHPPLPTDTPLQPNRLGPKDQSQSTVLFGQELLVKVLRRVWPGTSPEVELLEALDGVGFPGIARPLGVVEAEVDSTVMSLAVAQNYLRNGTDGFTLALTSLRDLYGDLVLDADGAVPLPDDVIRTVQNQGGSFAGAATQIGALTGEMHLALAKLPGGDEVLAQPFSSEDLEQVAHDLDELVERLLGLGDARLEPLAVHASGLHQLARRVVQLSPSGAAIRIHGDYHLGQLLRTDQGWHALDFEGRPSLPVVVRRRKASPLQDVAGMLRSFDYAATVALRQQVDSRDVSAASLEPYGRAWSAQVRDRFLSRYLEGLALGGTDLIPASRGDVDLLLTCLEASQALYEVDYELRSRPDWVSIPLEGIARLLHGSEQATASGRP
ncbi:MAG: maltokinase N-terminal cap-like domain-containing protein [Candidatus Dormibacteria bacterium]